MLLFALDREAGSLLRELPPGNEEPSYAENQTGKIDCLTPIRMSGVDNWCHKKRE